MLNSSAGQTLPVRQALISFMIFIAASESDKVLVELKSVFHPNIYYKLESSQFFLLCFKVAFVSVYKIVSPYKEITVLYGLAQPADQQLTC